MSYIRLYQRMSCRHKYIDYILQSSHRAADTPALNCYSTPLTSVIAETPPRTSCGMSVMQHVIKLLPPSAPFVVFHSLHGVVFHTSLLLITYSVYSNTICLIIHVRSYSNQPLSQNVHADGVAVG